MTKGKIPDKWDRLLKRIAKGRQGHAIFIPFTKVYPLMANVIDIAQDAYYLVGGDSGTGKSAFTHWSFVLWPYIWWVTNKEDTDIKLRIFVRSMERSWDMLIIKWACLMMYVKFNIVVDSKQILGRKSHNLTKDDWDKFERCIKFLRHAEDIITVIPGAINPTGILVQLVRFANENGITKVLNKEGKVIQLDPNNRSHVDLPFVEYIKDDPNLIVLNVVDHIGLAKREAVNSRMPNAGMLSEKGTLDRTSYYLRETRERYGFSHIVVQQFNRGIASIGRRNHTDLTPERSDYKGTANTIEDCDVNIALFEPWQYQVEDWKGYSIPKCVDQNNGKSRFRGISVLKNNIGQDNVHFGSTFVGECGHFKELPHPSKMHDNVYRSMITLPHARFA